MEHDKNLGYRNTILVHTSSNSRSRSSVLLDGDVPTYGTDPY